jgi:hypothetical protein
LAGFELQYWKLFFPGLCRYECILKFVAKHLLQDQLHCVHKQLQQYNKLSIRAGTETCIYGVLSSPFLDLPETDIRVFDISTLLAEGEIEPAGSARLRGGGS